MFSKSKGKEIASCLPAGKGWKVCLKPEGNVQYRTAAADENSFKCLQMINKFPGFKQKSKRKEEGSSCRWLQYRENWVFLTAEQTTAG